MNKDNHKGIVEVVVNNKIYKCWISANVIKRYIRKFLKEQFPEHTDRFKEGKYGH